MPRATTKKAAPKAAAKASAENNGLVVNEEGEVVTPATPPDSTEDWFVPMDETTEYANVLLYGREGAGKSTAIARLANIAPAGSKILLINAEGGLKPTALRKRGVDTSKIVMWPDPSKGQKVTRGALDLIHRRVQADLMADPNSWFAVAWDSVSEIHQAVLTNVTDRRVKLLTRQGKDPDPDFVDRSDYGTMSKMVRELLRKFRDLPCHFFCTALERRDKDDETKKLMVGPAVTPALASDLLGFVDMVLYLKAEDEQGPYRAMTKNSARFRVKDRFDVLPRVMVEPMGDRILGYLHEELSEESDPFQDDLTEVQKSSLDVKQVTTGEDDDEQDDAQEDKTQDD